jgi:tetratricopeptide (TPR) repeat protein
VPFNRVNGKCQLNRKSKQKSHPPATTGWRLWLFRFIAVTVIPVLLFLLLELFLRIVGYGFPVNSFVEYQAGGKDARPFYPFVFPKEKSENAYRVFVLGGSAAAGEPDAAYSFGRILQAMLRHRYPQTNFEVVITATTAINSHVILPISKDCARHNADLFVVYMGNNEVVGPYGAGTVFAPFSNSLPYIRFHIFFKTTRVGQLLTSFAGSLSHLKGTPKVWRGMEMFLENQIRENDPRLESVYHHFERNMEDIKRIACQSGTKIIFCTVGSNLKDCPPFASLHRSNLTASDERKWDAIYQEAAAYEAAGKYTEAVERYLAAAQIDDCYADLQFRLGKCYRAMGEFADARDRYIRARDLDTLRFRPHTQINEIIRRTASDRNDEGVYLVDADEVFEMNSSHKTTGEELFYEHVHLNFEGNYLLAKSVFEQVEKILPERIKRQRAYPSPMLTLKGCAQDLAYTAWEKYNSTNKILNDYIKKAPFTNQLYHKEQVEQLEQNLKALHDNLTPEVLKEADMQYRQAIEKNKDDWLLRQKYGHFLTFGLKDYRAGAEQYAIAVEYTDYYEYHAVLGGLLGKTGNLNAAIDHNLRAVQINSACVQAHNNLAIAYKQQDKIDKAIEHYYQTLRLQPENLTAYHDLATLLCEQGKVDKAVALYRKGLTFMPDSVVMHGNLGYLLSMQGKKQEAIEELRVALQIDPNSVQARKILEIINK